MIQAGRVQEALHELDTYVKAPETSRNAQISSSYLPSSPYQENTTLHTYAGLSCLYLHQEENACFGMTLVSYRYSARLDLDSRSELVLPDSNG